MKIDADGTRLFTVTLLTPEGERSIAVPENEHIWEVAAKEGIHLPAMCHQGWCLTCAARLVGDGDVDQSDSILYTPEDRAAGFVLPCTARPRSDLRIVTDEAVEMRKHRLRLNLPAPYSQGLEVE